MDTREDSVSGDVGSWRDYGPTDLPKPLAAALEAFAERGYDGTSIREVASRSGLSVPGLYHHYPSKQALLVSLTTTVLHDLLARSRQAIAEAGPTPSEKFDAVVESLLRFHMYRREQAFVGSTEIRSLDPGYHPIYIGHRIRMQRLVDDVVVAGVGEGSFTTGSPKGAARAVATMCVGVSTWYRVDGPMSADELIKQNLEFARAIVGFRSR